MTNAVFSKRIEYDSPRGMHSTGSFAPCDDVASCAILSRRASEKWMVRRLRFMVTPKVDKRDVVQ